MRLRSVYRLAPVAFAAVALLACDGSGDGSDAGADVDAGPRDLERPVVVETEPAAGATDVAPSDAIVVTFSEPMAPVGTVTITADGAPIGISPLIWAFGGESASIDPTVPLPAHARVQVRLATDFRDVAGNELVSEELFVFEVGDDAPPHVLSSIPAAGATDVSARLEAIEIRFDEPMDTSVGSIRLASADTTLGEATWLNDRTFRVPVEGLRYERTYRAFLEDFTDASGQELDDSVYLADGALEFSTGTDDDAPQVVDSLPSEGQLNVATLGTPSIVIVFDEPMALSRRTAEMTVGTETITLTGEWSDDRKTITFPAAGYLAPSGEHSIDLSAFEDPNGNAVDGAAYLEDGKLDFTTGADSHPPVVLSATPGEGTTSARTTLEDIVVKFDRAMDKTLATSMHVDDGDAGFEAATRWNLAGTELRLDVRGRLLAESEYHVDLRVTKDVRGMPLDAAAPYLADGVLDFETARGTGETCADALSIGSATDTATGGHEWRIAARAVTSREGAGAACSYRPEWISPDAVIHVRKTTPSASDGGTYLHVNAASATTARILLEVRSSCDPHDGATGRLDCPGAQTDWDSWLDVGPGDYFVWVSTNGNGAQAAFDGATVRVDEVAAMPEGEACAAPYDATSAVHSVVDGAHVFALPARAGKASDMTVTLGGAGSMACDRDESQGTDVVVALQKTSATSVLAAELDSSDAATVQVVATCAPGATAAASLGCAQIGGYTGGNGEVSARGAAGTYYAWVASDSVDQDIGPATLRVREVEPQTGDDCAHAIPIAATGTIAITPSRTERLDVPACFPAAGGVTWYRFTAAEAATVVRGSGAGAIAVVDPASFRATSCATDTHQRAMGAFVAPGASVCVAVSSTSSVSSLTLVPVAYAGNMGRATDLAIRAPVNPMGEDGTFAGETWMVATPTMLHFGQQYPPGIASAPRSGNTQADSRELEPYQEGWGGVAIGESVFGLDEAGFTDLGLGTIVGTADRTRLYRLVTSTGAYTTNPPADWDGTIAFGDRETRALAYDGAEIWIATERFTGFTPLPAGFYRASPTTPGRVVQAGTISAFTRVAAIAVDSTWLFVLGRVGADAGVFRVRRDALTSNPAPELIARASVEESARRGSVVVDSTANATVLYFRDADGDVRAVSAPSSATPISLGVISSLGDRDDLQLAYDAPTRSIFLIESETREAGRVVRLD